MDYLNSFVFFDTILYTLRTTKLIHIAQNLYVANLKNLSGYTFFWQ